MCGKVILDGMKKNASQWKEQTNKLSNLLVKRGRSMKF
jgi:hypothetical protein